MCTKFTLKGKPSFLSSLPGCILSTDKSEHSEQTPARKDNSTNGGQSPLRQVSKTTFIWSPLPDLLHPFVRNHLANDVMQYNGFELGDIVNPKR